MDSPNRFNHEMFDRLLRAHVSPEGRVDYAGLARNQAELDRYLAALASASPDSHPEQFPSENDALAYWINCYNAFILRGVLDEYPIKSVFETADGAFFKRKRFVAGGGVFSIDEIENEIIRKRFNEPRIHFALNCASNSCPVLYNEAFDSNKLDEQLSEKTGSFLRRAINFRVDPDGKKVFISRIFKFYPEDFSGGRRKTTGEMREDILDFIARYGDYSRDELRDYTLAYNIYDWGLNDVALPAESAGLPFHESVEKFHPDDAALREVLLYSGSFCNRACEWCTVNGSPGGWYRPYTAEVMDKALAALAPDGNLKFYGGEPTTDIENLLWAIGYARGHGFGGLITIYSNGVLAERLIRALESDDRSECVLNYSIWHGVDADPIPARAKEMIEQWAADHPMRVFTNYPVLFPVANGAEFDIPQNRKVEYYGYDYYCPKCFPVLTSEGRFEACPFAVELGKPHFRIGGGGDDSNVVNENYRRFRKWVDGVLIPEARRRQITPCKVCNYHLDGLQTPDYLPGRAAPTVVHLKRAK